MAVDKGFDELLDEILTDFRNVLPGVDVSQGSLAYMKAAGYASALWGLYRRLAWIYRQMFADTADTEALEHHAWIEGMGRVSGEDDAELLARYLSQIRNPPAGGNAHDYEMWAKEIDGVAQAVAIPLAQGGESVDVVILSDSAATGSEIPSAELLATVADHIATVRPVGARFIRVLAPEINLQDVVVSGVGGDDAETVASDINAYMDGFVPGDCLYPAQILRFALAAGAANPVVISPEIAVIVDKHTLIRPGEINVS